MCRVVELVKVDLVTCARRKFSKLQYGRVLDSQARRMCTDLKLEKVEVLFKFSSPGFEDSGVGFAEDRQFNMGDWSGWKFHMPCKKVNYIFCFYLPLIITHLLFQLLKINWTRLVYSLFPQDITKEGIVYIIIALVPYFSALYVFHHFHLCPTCLPYTFILIVLIVLLLGPIHQSSFP